MNIRFVSNQEVDKTKWNSCVHFANNGNIFGYKWYLDFVAKNWDGLIEGDYESVFPLVWRTDFFNRRELFQPDLMRAMGVYSINVLSHARVQRFLEAIPEEYRRIDITLNEQNPPPESTDFELKFLTNHQLMLNKPYEVLAEGFAPSLKEKLERAEEAGLTTTTSLKPETIADFYQRHTREKNRARNFHTLQRIMYNVLHRGWGYASGAYDTSGELRAVNFYIYSHGKVMSLVPVQSAEGEALGALPFLFHMLIRSHSGRPLILDFNTREEDELALAFGALPNRYCHLHRDDRFLGLF